MKIEIPCHCAHKSNGQFIVCAEKGRKISFLNPNKRAIVRFSIDGCSGLREIIKKPGCKLCDFLVVDWRANEHYVELKGCNVEHALKQLESTIEIFRLSGLTKRFFCWIITSESPASQSKFQVLKAKFEKKFNARLTIRTNQHEYCLE